MCDYFFQLKMENDQGDLADIVRAGCRELSTNSDFPICDWLLQNSETEIDAAGTFTPSTAATTINEFGYPFINFRDPLLMSEFTGVDLFNGAEIMAVESDSLSIANDRKVDAEENIKMSSCSNNIFSSVHQISTTSGGTKLSKISQTMEIPTPLITRAIMKISPSSIGSTPMDHSSGGVQISLPHATGIKRRKSQAKKVICIPAPPVASNRPSGEAVPSDLWAWRKYGQKPIKSSPYPRSYYRCSSSKGCSARKQVERSRTDPNMLVITYTSEHNHPWPTQRNALAGSTKLQPLKNDNSSSKNSNNIKKSSSSAVLEEEPNEMTMIPTMDLVKEEITNQMDNEIVPEEDSEFDEHFDQMFHQSFEPMIPETNQPDDFFADLAELELDPMNLIFTKGFITKPVEEKAIDSFSMFNWSSS